MPPNNGITIIAFDASLLTIGAIAVLDGYLAEAATFVHDTKALRGVEKYAWVAALQAADVAAFLDRYNRNIPILVEVPAHADGNVWQRRTTFAVTIGAGVVAGVAYGLKFEAVKLIPAGARGGWGGKRNSFLASALPGAELKTQHERDAAAMAVWYLSKHGGMK